VLPGDDLDSRVRAAMDIYNVKELEQCFKIGEYMGLPTNRFAEAKALFLELQNPDHVEEVLNGLLALKSASGMNMGPGDTVDAAITCLVNQQQRLGTRTDNKALQDVSERMAHTKTERGTQKYYSAAAAREKIIDTVFEDISNYKGLRDPLTWPTEYIVSYDLEKRTQSMVMFQAEKILQSMSIVKPELEKMCTQNFLDLLRCMGDKPCTYAGDKQDPIIKRLTHSRAVCDEIYLQTMKQLTSNPSVESASKGWELLQNMVNVALPSAEVYNFLIAFVTREATPPEPEQKDPMKTGLLKQGWRAAFLEESRRLRQKQQEEEGNVTLAGVAKLAMKDSKDKRKSVQRRKSFAALAENRSADLAKKRKAYAAKQVQMAQLVLRTLNACPAQPYNPAAV